MLKIKCGTQNFAIMCINVYQEPPVLTNLVPLNSIQNLSFYTQLYHLLLFLSTLNEFGD